MSHQKSEKLIILQVALFVPLRRCFDYLPPEACDLSQLEPGIRLKVPFGSHQRIGILIGVIDHSEVPFNRLKQATLILDSVSLLSPDILSLATWASHYYHHSLGEVLETTLPVLLRQGKPAKQKSKLSASTHFAEPTLPFVLNSAQQMAVNVIIKSHTHFNVFLLEGVTGSGKTEVYMRCIAHALQAHQQILILIPEIGLTPQTIARFQERFSTLVVALHSSLTDRERLNAWLFAASGEARIIIGTRSAIFTPLPALGLIIIDEEHDLSFKQQEGFRYHARDVAVMRAKMLDIPIILGSATPSLESACNVKQGRYQHLLLPERTGSAVSPDIQLIDIRKAVLDQGLSNTLLKILKETLEAGDQVLLFLNRRGFAPVLICHECGWMAECQRCDARMTYHQKPLELQCHHCGVKRAVPFACQPCGSKQLYPLGLGTARLEKTLAAHFPGYPIVRIDRDSTQKKGSMQTYLSQIHSGEARILLGTQMLAKGHHFPNVTLVAILDADTGLFSADFRGLERMGQLFIQVAGRAGRGDKPGKVLIQTHHPEHLFLQQLIKQSYLDFSDALLAERKEAMLPPFSYFALFRADATDMAHATLFLQHVRSLLESDIEKLTVMGPIPAPMPKKAARYRSQLLLHTQKRERLHAVLDKVMPLIEKMPAQHRVRWSLDVDPMELFS